VHEVIIPSLSIDNRRNPLNYVDIFV